MNTFYIAISLLSLSFIFSMIIVSTMSLHENITSDDINGVQKFHKSKTPRIGGIALAFAFLTAFLFIDNDIFNLWTILGISSIPCFFGGLFEDLFKNASTKIRISLTFLSGIVFVILSKYSINSIDVYGIDYLLSFFLISLFFTSFAIAGISNAINIIDGFNGLASGSVLIMIIGIAYISYKVSDYELLKICIFISAIILGFMLMNFPFGKIFLGDSGAYYLGFLLSCILVMAPYRNPEISPWTCLLICMYPFFETIFSILRKTKRTGHNFDRPDRLHLHMLIYRDVSRKISKKLKIENYRNSITSLILWPGALLPVVISVFFYNNETVIFVSIIIFMLCYLLLYRKLSLNELW